MLAKFLIVALLQITAAAHIEGGTECIENEKPQVCAEKLIDSAQPVDYSKMND